MGFLLGLFLTLSFFSFSNYFIFKNNIKTIEKFSSISKKDIDASSNIASLKIDDNSKKINILPKKSDKFILINTYTNNLSNNEQKWYDNNIDYSKLLSTDYNDGKYFTYNNTIELKNSLIAGGVNGADINKVQLNGPNALYFANNYSQNKYDLSEFSIIFILKIKNISNNIMLFEMLANTSTTSNTDDTDDITYIANCISIYLIINENKNYDIELTIGNSKFIIPNIDKNLILNIDVNLIGLIFNGTVVTFILNNNTYKFKYNKSLITLGSSPVIINKEGDLDAILYSFIYYKTAITLEDIIEYKKYNNYYIYGVNYIDNLKNKTDKLLIDSKNNSLDKDKRIQELLEQLNKCSNNNTSLINDTLTSSIDKIQELFPPLPTLL